MRQGRALPLGCEVRPLPLASSGILRRPGQTAAIAAEVDGRPGSWGPDSCFGGTGKHLNPSIMIVVLVVRKLNGQSKMLSRVPNCLELKELLIHQHPQLPFQRPQTPPKRDQKAVLPQGISYGPRGWDPNFLDGI